MSNFQLQSNRFLDVLSREASCFLCVCGLGSFHPVLSEGWLSWFGNTVVLFVLYRQRSTLQPTDYLTFNLAVSDASISVFGYSRGIIEIFNVFQDSGFIISSIWTCEVDGFFTLVFGLSSINTLTVISITRYIKGCQPSRGDSGYDRGYGTCEIDWSKAAYSTAYRSYIISIFIFCYFIPVFIMLFCYISIINRVKRGNALAAGDLTDRQRKMERDVTIVSIVICTAFILAWSPYAVVSMWSAWGFHVPNLTSIFTRLFAKSASFYNPLIYFGLSSKFRKDVAVLLPCTKDAKDTVKVKRFKTKADTHRRAASGARARLKAHLNQTERKYSPVMEPPSAPKAEHPLSTPPHANQQVFHIAMAPPSDAGSESECERL
ncbi:G-protein coupled receptor 136 [Takifugu flavidus]|uniref:G-protein coupled receptor 136 n=1 Tax=Takifugu flavidus TaxID=433684 RepID=A0A5C6MWM5_9TELE|nr:G-protein coupled receptor 136 [Takifugu flavidus]